MSAAADKNMGSQSTAVTQAELKCLLEIQKQSEKDGCAATNRIACELRIKPPSVCRVLDRLMSKLLITREPYGKIELTQRGKETVRGMRGRINAMQRVLMRQLHLSAESALETALYFACSMDAESQHAVLTCVQDRDPRSAAAK